MILLPVGPAPGALKAPEITRELSAAGHRVEVILGANARHFVGPAAFADIASIVDSPSVIPEAVLFAPADAATLARLANGLADDEAEARAASAHPAVVAPDLDAATAAHPAVRRNLELLREDGFGVVGSGEGMASVEEVVAAVLGSMGGPLGGLKLLVSAGGTREPIDSVRFVGNRSSGRMGRAIAREALRQGAEVSVVAANVEWPEPGVTWTDVETFSGMQAEVMKAAGEADALVMAAAVSDFTPASPERTKIRRSDHPDDRLVVELETTGDILEAAKRENPDLFVVGFAATHGDPLADAREKLRSKGVDLVVGNDVSRSGIGFGAKENEVCVVGRSEEHFVPRSSKAGVARAVLRVLLQEMREERGERHVGEDRFGSEGA